MKIWRRKIWEIWLRAVKSGRQKVDMQGAVPGEGPQCPSLYIVMSIQGLEHSQGNTYRLLFKLLRSGTAPRISTLCLLELGQYTNISQY